MNFYKHYIGDFQRDTGHLSLTERGAYLALIHHYYATEKPLPNNIDALCRIAGAVSAIERKAVKVAISFFDSVDSGLMHSRIEAEIHKAGEQSNTNRDIALAREAKRRAERIAKLEHENSTNRTESVPRNEHENSTNQTPDTRHQTYELINIQETNNIVEVSNVASVCIAMKKVYEENRVAPIDIIHSDQTLLALVCAGASEQEFIDATNLAIQKGVKNIFKYAIGTVKGQRENVKNINIHQGKMPQKSNRDAGRLAAAKAINFKIIPEQKIQEREVRDAKEIAN
jgi:uncharacterized protein YdaU (DUF1376 family)